MALTACTSEDVMKDVTTGRNIITFENVVNKPSRSDLDNTSLKKFYVYGYNITKGGDVVVDFVNEELTKNGGVWEYDKTNPRYWMPGAEYYFYAYSDDNGKIEETKLAWVKKDESNNIITCEKAETGCELALVNYFSNATAQSDLVFASETGLPALESGLNTPVSFQFDHILSKVQAMFANHFPEEYEVEVTNVVIKDIHGIGNFAPSYGWYSVESSNGGMVNLLATDGILKPKPNYNDGNKSAPAYVIPYTYNYENSTEEVKIEFNIKMTSKGEVVMDKVCTGKFKPNWKKGYTYTYNIVLSGSSTNLDVITFTTAEDGVGSVTNWSTDSEENPTFTF